MMTHTMYDDNLDVLNDDTQDPIDAPATDEYFDQLATAACLDALDESSPLVRDEGAPVVLPHSDQDTPIATRNLFRRNAFDLGLVDAEGKPTTKGQRLPVPSDIADDIGILTSTARSLVAEDQQSLRVYVEWCKRFASVEERAASYDQQMIDSFGKATAKKCADLAKASLKTQLGTVYARVSAGQCSRWRTVGKKADLLLMDKYRDVIPVSQENLYLLAKCVRDEAWLDDHADSLSPTMTRAQLQQIVNPSATTNDADASAKRVACSVYAADLPSLLNVLELLHKATVASDHPLAHSYRTWRFTVSKKVYAEMRKRLHSNEPMQLALSSHFIVPKAA